MYDLGPISAFLVAALAAACSEVFRSNGRTESQNNLASAPYKSNFKLYRVYIKSTGIYFFNTAACQDEKLIKKASARPE